MNRHLKQVLWGVFYAAVSGLIVDYINKKNNSIIAKGVDKVEDLVEDDEDVEYIEIV